MTRFYRDGGVVDFTLSTGERLAGPVHVQWLQHGADLRVTSLDLRSAYKQLPLHPLDYDKSVICVKCPDTGEIECYFMLTLPFGARASVHDFLRVSTLLHAAGCALGVCWASYFDDFPMASHARTETSAMATCKGMLSLLGYEYAVEKMKPFAQKADMLGVQLDVSQTSQGVIKIRNKESRVRDLQPVLDAAISTASLIPAELPSFLGKLQYAEAQLWGRAGRLALYDLRQLNHLQRTPVHLDDPGVAALRVLRDRLLHGRPRTIKASAPTRPFLVFTDGALEGSQASIGGVLVKPQQDGSASIFGGPVPPEALMRWQSDGKLHVVGLVELYGAVVALRHWRPQLCGERVIVFIDNWPTLDVLIKGAAFVPLWRELLLVLEDPLESEPTLCWFARVPSKSNIADGPSRADLGELRPWSLRIDKPVCPLTGQKLASFFQLKQTGEK